MVKLRRNVQADTATLPEIKASAEIRKIVSKTKQSMLGATVIAVMLAAKGDYV